MGPGDPCSASWMWAAVAGAMLRTCSSKQISPVTVSTVTAALPLPLGSPGPGTSLAPAGHVAPLPARECALRSGSRTGQATVVVERRPRHRCLGGGHRRRARGRTGRRTRRRVPARVAGHGLLPPTQKRPRPPRHRARTSSARDAWRDRSAAAPEPDRVDVDEGRPHIPTRTQQPATPSGLRPRHPQPHPSRAMNRTHQPIVASACDNYATTTFATAGLARVELCYQRAITRVAQQLDRLRG
jgi:hypothetical protein